MNFTFKKTALYTIFLAFISIILLMCAVPPVSRDALIHHLAVPALYLDNGRILELPHIKASYYPQLLDLIYCIPLYFKNDILPKYIHFLFALLTACLLYHHVKNRIDKTIAVLSALFFLSLPVIIKLSTTVYVDLGLIFFSFAGFLSLLKWRKENFKLKWLLLAALCCGFALSTKYNGLITFFILTVFILFLYLGKTDKGSTSQIKGLLYCMLFFAVSLFVFSPWMVKNYAWTGNPLYPLYKNVFSGSDQDPDQGLDQNQEKESFSWNHFLVRKYVYNEAWYETALIPVRIFFQGEDDNPKYFDGRLNPLLFFLPFLGFWGIVSRDTDHEKIEKKFLLTFSILFILFVFFQTDMRIRWMGPAIPPLVVLSAYGMERLIKLRKKIPVFVFWPVCLIIIVTAGLNFVYLYNEFKEYSPVRYITGAVDRDQYIQKRRPEYASLQFANTHLDKNAKILAFFLGKRRYYCEHEIFFKKKVFVDLVRSSANAEAVFEGLKKEGFSHLVVNYSKLNHWIDISFETPEKRTVKKFFTRYTVRLFAKDNHGLYSLEHRKKDTSKQ